MLGEEVDSGVEAGFDGAGVPRYGFRFYPLGGREPKEVFKQRSNTPDADLEAC